MKSWHLTGLLAAALLPACRSAGGPSDADRRLQPDHAPTPYTAAQIRSGCPAGREVTFLLEAAGKPATHQILRFVKCDETGADIEARMSQPDGTPIGRPKTSHSAWTELQTHASFPEAGTTIAEGTAETPAGRFEGPLYTVTSKENGATTVRRFQFARNLPGPPVRMTVEADGKTTFTMTMVRNTPAP